MGLVVGKRADPDFEDLVAAGHVHRWHAPAATLRECLDVGVVAVVEAADFADDLEQVARLVAMFAEPGVGDPQGVEIRFAAAQVDGEAETDGGVGVGFGDQEDFAAIEFRGVDGDAGVYRGFRRINAALPGNRLPRQSRKRSFEPRPQFIVNPTAQPGPRVSRMVVAP